MESSLTHHRWRHTDTRHECEGEYESYFFLRVDTISGDVELEIFSLHTLSLLIGDEAINEIEGSCSITSLKNIESTMYLVIDLIESIAMIERE